MNLRNLRPVGYCFLITAFINKNRMRMLFLNLFLKFKSVYGIIFNINLENEKCKTSPVGVF